MKIAILDGFPNLPNSAEAEFIRRFAIACGNLGNVDSKGVSCSKEIYEYEPDVVLVSHESARKLTRFPTIGLLWSPLAFFQDNDYRITSVTSYDGYITGNKALSNFCKDIQFGTHANKTIGKEHFLPTTYQTDYVAIRDVEVPTLSYMGVHWDGGRHRKVFDMLSGKDYVTFYGPEQSWQRHAHRYGGMLPFDGRSVQAALASHGISLCFHKREHRIENTPSMRIFEAVSVGAIPICDEIEFARTELADVALFVDTTRSPETIVAQIDAHVQWIRDNREEAIARALRGKEWFAKHWSLEAKIQNCIIPTLQDILETGNFSGLKPEPQKTKASAKPVQPSCEVVVRTGGRDLDTLKRSIASIEAANTQGAPLGVVLVDYKSREDIQAYAEKLKATGLPVKYIQTPDNGCRSTPLWAGIKAVTAPYTAILDDDDTVYPNHYSHLVKILEAEAAAPLAYSGCIRKEDSEGVYFKTPSFDGPLKRVIEEDRELCFASPYDFSRLAHFDNYITSNSWVARTDLLQKTIGDDPELQVAEDIFLLLLMAKHGRFEFSYSPTSVWHWQSKAAVNSMTAISRSTWKRETRRVLRRLNNLAFYYAPSLEAAKLLKPVTTSHIDIASNIDSAVELPTIPYDFIVDDQDLDEYARHIGFHATEVTGVWSKTRNAVIKIKLDSEVKEKGGILAINFLTSCTGQSDRMASIRVAGGPVQKFTTNDWQPRLALFDLKPQDQDIIEIEVDVDSLYSKIVGGTETRPLGVHIKSIGIFQSQTDAIEAHNTKPAGYGDVTPKTVGSSYYESGDYRQVEISNTIDGSAKSLFKMQQNGSHLSLEVDIQNLIAGENITSDYIETDRIPVLRIYFNGHHADMCARYDLLPARLKKAITDTLQIENGLVLSDIATEYRGRANTIMDDIRTEMKALIDYYSANPPAKK